MRKKQDRRCNARLPSTGKPYFDITVLCKYIPCKQLTIKITLNSFSLKSFRLDTKGGQKKYIGIAKALFAYAASVSVEAGFGGVLFFKAKTSELREYYIREFGAMPLGSYDPFRLIIWEDAAERIISEYQ